MTRVKSSRARNTGVRKGYAPMKVSSSILLFFSLSISPLALFTVYNLALIQGTQEAAANLENVMAIIARAYI